MKASTFTFAAPDGVEIFVYEWLPDGPARGAVQIAHGMAEHAGRYGELGRYLAERGYAVYANDHRGHGQTARSDEELGHFADKSGWNKVLGDLHQLSGIVKKRHEGVPFVLFGHSMGSFFSQHFLFAFPGEVDGVVLSGSNGKAGALASAGEVVAKLERARLGPRGKSKLLTNLSFGAFNKQFAPNRTAYDWLSRDPAAVDAYIADPRCGFAVSTQVWVELLAGMRTAGLPKNQARIPKDLPVYIFSGEKDPVSNQGKGVGSLVEAYKAAGLTNVESRIYPDARHEMLNETNRDEVMAHVAAWIDGVVAAKTEQQKAA